MVFFYGALVIFWMAIKEKLMNPYLFGCVGLLLGASMLVRAIGVGLGIVLSFLLWVLAGDVKNKIKFQMIFMLLLGNLIIVTPWEAWVYAQTGKVIPLSQGGVLRVKGGLLLPVNKQDYYQGVKLPRDVKELIKQLETKRHRMTSLPNIGTIIIEEFKNQPWVVTKFMVIKLARGWYGTDSQRFEMPIMLLQIPVLALILWSSFLAWNYGGWKRKFVIFVWALVLYFWCITTLVISLVRFMVPAMALLFLLLPAAGEKMRSLVRPYASFPKELHDSK